MILFTAVFQNSVFHTKLFLTSIFCFLSFYVFLYKNVILSLSISVDCKINFTELVYIYCRFCANILQNISVSFNSFTIFCIFLNPLISLTLYIFIYNYLSDRINRFCFAFVHYLWNNKEQFLLHEHKVFTTFT